MNEGFIYNVECCLISSKIKQIIFKVITITITITIYYEE